MFGNPYFQNLYAALYLLHRVWNYSKKSDCVWIYKYKSIRELQTRGCFRKLPFFTKHIRMHDRIMSYRDIGMQVELQKCFDSGRNTTLTTGEAYLYGTAVVLPTFMQPLLGTMAGFRYNSLGIRIKAALCSLIHKKVIFKKILLFF